MSANSSFRQYDTGPTAPPLVENLTADGAPADVSGADHVALIGYRGATVLFNDPVQPTLDDTAPTPVACVVTHVWADGELDVAGRIRWEAVAVWPDGSTTTFPTDGCFAADVKESVRQAADVP